MEQEVKDPFFVATVEGEDFTRSFNGNARFGLFTEPEIQEDGIMIQMSSTIPEEGQGILLIGKMDYIPESGSYDLVNFDEDNGIAFENIDQEEFYGVFLVGTLDQEDYSEQFKSVEGNISFENYENEILQGELEFTAVGYQNSFSDDSIKVDIQAEFEAAESEIDLEDGIGEQ